MKKPYTYCSRCGDELPEWLQEKYEEEHQSGPILCIDCVGEVISGIGDALKPVMDAYKTMMRNALESLSESFNSEESE